MKLQPCKTTKKAIKSSFGYQDQEFDNKNKHFGEPDEFGKTRYNRGIRMGKLKTDTPFDYSIEERLIDILRESQTIPFDDWSLVFVTSLLTNKRVHNHKYLSSKQMKIIENYENYIKYEHEQNKGAN
jgi:hypothetical protein